MLWALGAVLCFSFVGMMLAISGLVARENQGRVYKRKILLSIALCCFSIGLSAVVILFFG